jgi:phosphate transport system substrate-binding protein
MGDDLKVSIADAPGSGAYPISSFTWFVVPAAPGDAEKRRAIMGFLNWMTGPGQAQAAALGYVALPKDVVDRERAALERLK